MSVKDIIKDGELTAQFRSKNLEPSVSQKINFSLQFQYITKQTSVETEENRLILNICIVTTSGEGSEILSMGTQGLFSYIA